MIQDYMKAIHPECGTKVEIYKDIIITPFYTEEFCDYLVSIAKYFDSRFFEYINYNNSLSALCFFYEK